MKWTKAKEDAPPEGLMLVRVETSSDPDYNVVYVDDDGQDLIEPEYGDVWTSWGWGDVTEYIFISDIRL